ncbi:hypothetical protein AMECASPLE_009655 [Ameca splendens]|uniref:Uncharacterized protein n=1 Tax=Ameca splendens TaxID=208324 RepID=A0ABV0ZL22_9TELE
MKDWQPLVQCLALILPCHPEKELVTENGWMGTTANCQWEKNLIASPQASPCKCYHLLSRNEDSRRTKGVH